MNYRPHIVALALGLALPICAAEADEASGAKEVSPTQTIEKCLRASGMDFEVRSVQPAPISGLQEVEVDGGEYLYVTEDCRHLLVGNLFELHDGGVVSITERRRNAQRQTLLADVPISEMLVYSPESDTRATVTVFTDIDCGYCRQMHNSMAKYHAHGIEVRYLAYPRAGIDSPTYKNMVSAWCANDPLDALTTLKRGEEVPAKSCVNPVAEQYELGQQMGITGTPSIILQDGNLIPGMVTADRLAEMLGI